MLFGHIWVDSMDTPDGLSHDETRFQKMIEQTVQQGESRDAAVTALEALGLKCGPEHKYVYAGTVLDCSVSHYGKYAVSTWEVELTHRENLVESFKARKRSVYYE